MRNTPNIWKFGRGIKLAVALVAFGSSFAHGQTIYTDTARAGLLSCNGFKHGLAGSARLSWLDTKGNYAGVTSTWNCDANTITAYSATIQPGMVPNSNPPAPIGGWSVTISLTDAANTSCTTMGLFSPGQAQAFTLTCTANDSKGPKAKPVGTASFSVGQ